MKPHSKSQQSKSSHRKDSAFHPVRVQQLWDLLKQTPLKQPCNCPFRGHCCLHCAYPALLIWLTQAQLLKAPSPSPADPQHPSTELGRVASWLQQQGRNVEAVLCSQHTGKERGKYLLCLMDWSNSCKASSSGSSSDTARWDECVFSWASRVITDTRKEEHTTEKQRRNMRNH